MRLISELRNAASKTDQERRRNRQTDTCPLLKIVLNPSQGDH